MFCCPSSFPPFLGYPRGPQKPEAAGLQLQQQRPGTSSAFFFGEHQHPGPGTAPRGLRCCTSPATLHGRGLAPLLPPLRRQHPAALLSPALGAQLLSPGCSAEPLRPVSRCHGVSGVLLKTITCLFLSVLCSSLLSRGPTPPGNSGPQCQVLGREGRGHGANGVTKASPPPGLGASAGPSGKRGSPRGTAPWMSPPRAPPGLSRALETGALHLLPLFGPRRGRLEGQRGRSAAGARGVTAVAAPRGSPERPAGRGAGVFALFCN